MSPVTHFFMAWTVANAGAPDRRTRAAVTLAGLVPDVDGLGVIAEAATRENARALTWYSDFHHVLGHNLLVGALLALACAAIARGRPATGVARSGRTAFVALLGSASFHLHLVGDLVGSRGPDGEQWAIAYLWPFSRAWAWRVPWQWELNAWPNILVTALLLGLTLYLARRRGFSPLELISARADAALVRTLRR